MKKDPFNENLIDQARVFYMASCIKSKVKQILINRNLIDVSPDCITMRNSRGELVEVHYNTTHLSIEVNGVLYSRKIRLPMRSDTHNQLQNSTQITI